MENPVRKAAEVSSARMDEEGMPADLQRVRSVLQSMPKLNCPVGFEFRLQRRIEGLSAAPSRTASGRSWTLGWAGAGLGFATALVIAMLVFDFGFNVPNASTQAITSATPQTTAPATQPDLAKAPQVPPTNAQPLESVNGDLAQEKPAQASKDSNAAKTPTEFPESLYHTVSGNNP